ncbi:MAG: adenine deaminase C-terminal domain-containing protein [Pseudomonadota bacterium]
MELGPLTAVKKRNSRLLMDVALGKVEPDLVITNARLVNVYTHEILDNQAVAVKGEWIAYVGGAPDSLIGPSTRVIDAAGRFLTPGLIEGHTHLAWFFGIEEFLKYAVPGGTTTIITECLEPYPVSGISGALDFLNSLQDQPIKIFATAPAMVSISGKTRGIDPEDLQTLLNRDDILGIGESYWQSVVQSPEVYLPAFERALEKGKLLEGHSAGARNHKLCAYAACGITSCHEPISAGEALERLRLGIYVMAREGSVRRDLKAISEIKDQPVDLRRLIISTDGIQPVALMENGYMDHVVRRAVGYGFDPVTALQMATINVAEHFRIDHLVGGIGPGKYADMILLPDLNTFSPDLVISCGKVVSENGRMTVSPRHHVFLPESKQTIRLPAAFTAADFKISAPPEEPETNVRVIDMVTDLVTGEKMVAVPVHNGEIGISVSRDLLKISAVDRTHGPGRMFTGLIHGWGLKTGALASSGAWDTTDIIVVGADESDMALAVNRIIELQGGAVLCAGGKIVLELALPIFGLITQAPMAEIAAKVKGINEKVNALGVSFPDALLSVITLTSAAIPYLKICEEGLVSLKDGMGKSLFIA